MHADFHEHFAGLSEWVKRFCILIYEFHYLTLTPAGGG